MNVRQSVLILVDCGGFCRVTGEDSESYWLPKKE